MELPEPVRPGRGGRGGFWIEDACARGGSGRVVHSDCIANLGYGMCSGMFGSGGRRLNAAEREMGDSRSWKSLDVGDIVDRKVMQPLVKHPRSPDNATTEVPSKTTMWSRMKSSVSLSFDCCSRGSSKVACTIHESECMRLSESRTHLARSKKCPYLVPFIPLVECN